MNKAIVVGLKKRLEGAKGRWAKEFPNVPWAFRTTPRSSTGKTPLSMTYETEAMVPAEIGLSSMRVSDFTPKNNDASMAEQLDLLEERQDMALIRLAEYQQWFKDTIEV